MSVSKASRMRLLGAWTLSAWVSSMLVACGGGGGDPTPPPVQPPVVPSIVMEGTAATGAAIAGAAVQAQCVNGTGSATTANDGRFTISIQGAAFPCVLKVTTSTGAVLHSVATGPGDVPVVGNITPLSQLLVSRLAGGNAASLFSSFDSAAQAKVTASAITQELATLRAALSAAVDLTGIDPLRDALVAANGSTGGNALDQKLDQLQAALAGAQLTLAQIEQMLQANGASAAEVVKSQLRPTAVACPTLRSGTYRWIDTYATGAAQSSKVTVDAAALTLSFANGPMWTGTALSTCRYSADAGKVTLVVSKDGVVIVRYTDVTARGRLAIAFPEQELPPSDLQGQWNLVTYRVASNGSFDAWHGDMTVDAQGTATAARTCRWLGTCSATPANLLPVFAPKAGGGFTLSTGGVAGDTGYVFKTASGDRLQVIVPSDSRSVTVAAPVRTLTLPTVGALTTIWDTATSNTGDLFAFSEVSTTIATVNEASRSYTRTRADGRVDGFALDTPLPGLRYRAQGTSTLSNGMVISYSSMVVLPATTGLSVYITNFNGANISMGVSVTQ